MKTILFFSCLSFALFSFSDAGSPEPLTISTELMGDFFTATSDNSNDRLVSIKVYDTSQVLRVEKSCGLTLVCTINLSSLPSGNYTAKVFSQYDNIAQSITLN